MEILATPPSSARPAGQRPPTTSVARELVDQIVTSSDLGDPAGARRTTRRCRPHAAGPVDRPIALGVFLGELGGIGLGRLLNSMFWKMTAPERSVLAGIAAVMLVASIGAAWSPIGRMLTVDLQRLLRSE